MSAEPNPTTPTEAWTSWESVVVDGRFTLRRFLGGSDHAAVFLTEHKAKNLAEAAIKFVRADASQAKTLLVHWQAAMALSHPHLVQLFEVGRWQSAGQDYLFVVMEYGDQTLAEILRRRALSAEETLELLPPVLDALTFLHRRQLIHGRLRPSNLLAVGDQLKLASDTIRRSGDGLSMPTDVWHLGATLVEALSRRVSGDHSFDTSSLPAGLPASLVDTVRRCLISTPADRPSVIELRAEYKLSTPGAEPSSKPNNPPPPPSTSRTATPPQPAPSASPSLAPAQPAPSASRAPAPAQPASSAAAARETLVPQQALAPSRANVPPQTAAAPSQAGVAPQSASSASRPIAPTQPASIVSQASGPLQPAPRASQAGAPTQPTPVASRANAPTQAGPGPSQTDVAPPSAPGASRPSALTQPASLGTQVNAPTQSAPGSALAGAQTQSPPSASRSDIPTQPIPNSSRVSAPPQPTPIISQVNVPAPPEPDASRAGAPLQSAPGTSRTNTPPQRAPSASQAGSPAQPAANISRAGAPTQPTLNSSRASVRTQPTPNSSRASAPSQPRPSDSQASASSASPSTASRASTPLQPPPSNSRVTVPQPATVAEREENEQPSAPKRHLFLSATAAVLLLLLAIWGGSRFTNKPQPSPQTTIVQEPTPPLQLAAPEPATIAPPEEQPVEPPAATSVLNEVLPTVPEKIRNKVQGRVYVTVRALVDPNGNVIGVLMDNAGPSKYFARLSEEAARQWQFIPADTEDSRVWLIRFQYTRDGVATHTTEQ